MLLNHVYRYVSRCQSGDQAGENVRFFRVTVLTGPIADAPFQDQLDGNMSTFYVPLMSNLATFAGSTMQDVTTGPPFPNSRTTSLTGHVGTAGASPLPCQVSGIYTPRTDLSSRSNRGRVYVPFPATADSTVEENPRPTLSYVGRLADLATFATATETFTIGGFVVTIQWVLQHRSPLGYSDLTEFVLRQSWATQRRRGDYGRPNPPI